MKKPKLKPEEVPENRKNALFSGLDKINSKGIAISWIVGVLISSIPSGGLVRSLLINGTTIAVALGFYIWAPYAKAILADMIKKGD